MTIQDQEQEWEEKNIEEDPADDEEDEDDDDDDDEDEEDLIDPMTELREDCSSKPCSGFQSKYQECNDRVNSRSQTEEDCSEELFDFMHCRDHCVSKVLFKTLK